MSSPTISSHLSQSKQFNEPAKQTMASHTQNMAARDTSAQDTPTTWIQFERLRIAADMKLRRKHQAWKQGLREGLGHVSVLEALERLQIEKDPSPPPMYSEPPSYVEAIDEEDEVADEDDQRPDDRPQVEEVEEWSDDEEEDGDEEEDEWFDAEIGIAEEKKLPYGLFRLSSYPPPPYSRGDERSRITWADEKDRFLSNLDGLIPEVPNKPESEYIEEAVVEVAEVGDDDDY